MLFNSLAYGIFLVLVFVTHYLLPHRFRWALLLAFSYYFYMSWNPELAVLILFTTAVSYFSAIGIDKSQDHSVKKTILVVGVSVCLACLFFFKYFNFVSENVTALLRAFSLPVSDFTINVILPVGISFYTFQTLSYIVDVYRGDLECERHFGYYALYVSFFPQLVAGPIERATNLLPQLHKEREFDYGKSVEGVWIIVLGLFKKIVVADVAAEYVNIVYNDIGSFGGLSIVVATLFFAMQVYCDFSGYSDIAIGSAKLLGIDLMTNFRSPYFAYSIKDFWRRWHISLSGWFTDYIYIPLGGSRVSRSRQIFNLSLVFLCSGIWHGANWTFIIWGLYHGILRSAELLLDSHVSRFEARLGTVPASVFRAGRVLLTFGLVLVSWVFFRANDVGDLVYAVNSVFTNLDLTVAGVNEAFRAIGITKRELLWVALPIATVLGLDYAALKKPLMEILAQKPFAVRTAVIWLLAFAVLLRIFTAENISAADFIYFQF